MRTTHVIVTFEAKPEYAERLLALLSNAKTHLPEVAGCQAARLFKANDDRPVFTLLEDWDSPAAHQVHIRQVVASGGWEAIAACLAREPESHYYVEV